MLTVQPDRPLYTSVPVCLLSGVCCVPRSVRGSLAAATALVMREQHRVRPCASRSGGGRSSLAALLSGSLQTECSFLTAKGAEGTPRDRPLAAAVAAAAGRCEACAIPVPSPVTRPDMTAGGDVSALLPRLLIGRARSLLDRQGVLHAVGPTGRVAGWLWQGVG